MPSSFYTSNMSLASELGLDRAKDFVKGSLKALNIGASTEHRIKPECEQPILKQSSSDLSIVPQKTQGWTPLLILTGIATTIGCSIPVGYNIGVMNNPAHIIRQFCNSSVEDTYGITVTTGTLNLLWSMIVSIFLIGGVTGSLTGGWVADNFGRKGSVAIIKILGIAAAVFFFLSRQAGSVEMLLVARLVVGLSSGLTTSIVPMYLTEIAPLAVRGPMGVLCPLGINVGVLLGQVMGLKTILGLEETWHYLLCLYALLIVLAAISYPFLPESPKYLYVVKNQEERAIRELMRLRGTSSEMLEDELSDMRQASKTEADAGGTWSLLSVAKAPTLRLPLLLVCALQAGQQCAGINAVFYYSVSIFESAGLSKDSSQYASIGAGSVNLFTAIIAIPLVSRCGRRPLVLLSCCTLTFFLIMLTICITYIDALSWMPYACIFTVLAYVFCYGLGIGPIPYFIGSELFEVSPRPVAMSFGSMANWGGNFIVGMTFPSLQAAIGQYSFLLFAFCTILLTVFLKYYCPETKGRDPSDIAEILKYGFRSQIKAIPLSAARQRHTSINSTSSRFHRNSEGVVTEVNSDAMFHSGILVQNNSYTNLPAIPELPGTLPGPPVTVPMSPVTMHPVRSLSVMMPSIPENLGGYSVSEVPEVPSTKTNRDEKPE